MTEDEIGFRELVEQVPAIVYRADVGESAEWQYISPAVERILGYTPDEFTTQIWVEALHPDDRERVLREEEKYLLQDLGEAHASEYRLRARDGQTVWVRDEFVLVRDAEGRPFYRGVMLDITERKLAERALELSERRFRSLVQNASDVIALMDPDTTIRYISPAVEAILGFAPEEMIGVSAFASVHRDDAGFAKENLRELLSRENGFVRAEVRARHKDGSWRWVEVMGTNLLHDPGVGGIVINYRDVTERRALEDQLRHKALHDPLTGLANRTLLADRLEHAMAGVERHQLSLALLFVDLDNFKTVNDTLGHSAGDELLIEVAERLQLCMRRGDTAARHSGDEFVVLLESVTQKAAVGIAERMLRVIGAPFVYDGNEITIGASVGIALSRSDQESSDPADLLRKADAAMYAVKNRARVPSQSPSPQAPSPALSTKIEIFAT